MGCDLLEWVSAAIRQLLLLYLRNRRIYTYCGTHLFVIRFHSYSNWVTVWRHANAIHGHNTSLKMVVGGQRWGACSTPSRCAHNR